MTSETRSGKTPSGGVKSVIYYQDDRGQPADKDEATAATVVEYDEQGRELRRTYADLTGREDE